MENPRIEACLFALLRALGRTGQGAQLMRSFLVISGLISFVTLLFVVPASGQDTNQLCLEDCGIDLSQPDLSGLIIEDCGIDLSQPDLSGLIIAATAAVTMAFITGMIGGSAYYVGDTIARTVGELGYFALGLVYGDEEAEVTQIRIEVHDIIVQ